MPTADLGSLSDYPDGAPAKASGGGRDFVVVRRGEGASVLDHACQHLGAPLSKGLVRDGQLICPWHRAVFDLDSGALVEPPGCNQQRAYETAVTDGRLTVSWAEDEAPHPAPPVPGEPTDARRYVVIGAGAAGLTAAETLAQRGAGEIVLIDREDASPYDRTKLSKGLTTNEDDVRLREAGWLQGYGVTLRRGEVASIDPESRTVTFEDGSTLQADGLVVAPGAEPNKLEMPGADLAGVLTLRSVRDALALSEAAKGADRAVVIGSGFIGMEAATVLSGEGVDVTIVAQDEVPFAGLLGERVGKRLRAEQEAAGVRFIGGAEASAVEGDGRAEAVTLADGQRLPADLVVMAVGVTPRAGLLDGIEPADDGGITVAEDTSLPGYDRVALAGDIARVPTAWGDIRVEHWRWAQQLGRMAAASVMSDGQPYRGTPYFWSKQQANGSYVYVGHAEDWDEIAYRGNPDEDDDFAAYYVKNGRVMAAFGHGMPDHFSGLERRMAEAGPLPKEEVMGKRAG